MSEELAQFPEIEPSKPTSLVIPALAILGGAFLVYLLVRRKPSEIAKEYIEASMLENPGDFDLQITNVNAPTTTECAILPPVPTSIADTANLVKYDTWNTSSKVSLGDKEYVGVTFIAQKYYGADWAPFWLVIFDQNRGAFVNDDPAVMRMNNNLFVLKKSVIDTLTDELKAKYAARHNDYMNWLQGGKRGAIPASVTRLDCV